MSWGSGSLEGTAHAAAAHRIQGRIHPARLWAAIIDLAFVGDVDGGPAFAVDAQTAGARRPVAGEPHTLWGRRLGLGKPDGGTIRGAGGAWLRSNLPNRPEAFRDHVEAPVVHQKLHHHRLLGRS